MNARAPLLAAAVAAATLAACAPPTMYAWNNYDQAMYRHYKNPQDREAWVAALKTAVLESEQEGRRTPPGLYAEYGYALYEEGKAKDSIVYFEKEKAKWPESRVLMETMIRNANRRDGNVPPPAAKGPAGSLEKKPGSTEKKR
ncbi:MAG: DUF4810 domain-containing protein [Anaeromyxobacteraceae bacterium]